MTIFQHVCHHFLYCFMLLITFFCAIFTFAVLLCRCSFFCCLVFTLLLSYWSMKSNMQSHWMFALYTWSHCITLNEHVTSECDLFREELALLVQSESGSSSFCRSGRHGRVQHHRQQRVWHSGGARRSLGTADHGSQLWISCKHI